MGISGNTMVHHLQFSQSYFQSASAKSTHHQHTGDTPTSSSTATTDQGGKS